MDVTGVFGYSDEDGTEAASYDDKLDDDEVWARAQHVTALVEELTAQRAEERIGEEVAGARREPSRTGDGGRAEGRAAFQGPEVDGTTTLSEGSGAVGDLVPGRRRRHRGRRPGGPPDRAGPMTDAAAGPAGRQQLEPPQRADHAAHRAGAGLRLVPARPRPRLDPVALPGLRRLRRGDDHRQDRRRHRPRPRPGHRLRQDRRPDRRQGDDRAWRSSRCRSSATSGGRSRSWCWCASGR